MCPRIFPYWKGKQYSLSSRELYAPFDSIGYRLPRRYVEYMGLGKKKKKEKVKGAQ